MDYNTKLEIAKTNGLVSKKIPQGELDTILLEAKLIEEKDTKAYVAPVEKETTEDEDKSKNEDQEPAAKNETLKIELDKIKDKSETIKKPSVKKSKDVTLVKKTPGFAYFEKNGAFVKVKQEGTIVVSENIYNSLKKSEWIKVG